MSRNRPSFLGALSVLVLVGGLLYWWVNALTNEDPFWFLKSFNARADWIVVYWDGTTCMFFPGEPEYDAVMDAFSEAVAHWSGYENRVGMSAETLERLRQEERLLELHYNDPVRVHTRYAFPEARNFFVPLSGTHADWRRVFAGLTDEPRIGVLNVSPERFSALQDIVEQAIIQDRSLP